MICTMTMTIRLVVITMLSSSYKLFSIRDMNNTIHSTHGAVCQFSTAGINEYYLPCFQNTAWFTMYEKWTN